MPPILVLGATGTQGAAVADALLATGRSVRALVRDSGTAAAQALAARGVDLATGSMDDEPVLAAAMSGVAGVFSVLMVGDDSDPGLEMRSARAIVGAALRTGVPMLVHSSVARAGDHESFAGWAEHRWWERYWLDKAAANALVREAGLPAWTILKPAFLMDNLLLPKAPVMLHGLDQRRLVTAMAPGTRLDLLAAETLGHFAAAAFADPARFAGEEIALAAQSLTMGEIAAILTEVSGRPVVAEHLSPEDAAREGLWQAAIDGHQWDEVEGYRVDIAALSRFGIALVGLAEWLPGHVAELPFGARAS